MAPRGLHQGAKAQGRLVIEALVFQHGLAGVLHPSTRRALYELSIHMASARAGCASDLGPLLGGQPDARDAGPAVSCCVCGL